MNRRTGVVAGAVIVAAVLLVMRGRSCDGTAPSRAPHGADPRGGGPAAAVRARVDPTRLARASIRGTIRDEGKAPIARASVCANAIDELLPASLRELRCAITDDRGQYEIAELVAADYLVHASARQFLPAAFHPTPRADRHDFPLAPGEARTGVDVELRRG